MVVLSYCLQAFSTIEIGTLCSNFNLQSLLNHELLNPDRTAITVAEIMAMIAVRYKATGL